MGENRKANYKNPYEFQLEINGHLNMHVCLV